jgi:thiol-disulfide isomerase/thioredoxin
LAGTLAADEVRVGSSRDEVIAAYGTPRAVLSAGSREILTYDTGRVILTDGRVSKLELPPKPRPPPVAVAPAPASVVTAAAPPPPAAPARDVWLTSYAEAQAEAAASKRRILALFTGSDWCPACMDFEQNVAHHPDFLATTHASFVLLKLDYPRAGGQPPELRATNEELRKRYHITAYPSLFILSADGATSVRVVNNVSRQADDAADYYVQAVDEARRAKPSEKSWWWPF